MSDVGAVVTTGIYCVPGCPGRPQPGNVRPFRCAAAAEAVGFRACHRCRPYRVDAETTGTPLVTRAVELIAAGALDDAGEAELAARLGTSPRHLRRCVIQELGATPDQLARSRRAHLARRLLDDTDLPIGDVAFAAGFGSLRQFNRQLREVFGDTPGGLRARRRQTDRLVADGGLALRLPAVDLPAWLDRRAEGRLPGVESVDADGYRRVVVLHGDPGVVEIRPGPVLVAHLPRLHGVTGLAERARLFVTDRAPWDPLEDAVRAAVPDVEPVITRLGRPVPGLARLGLTHAFPTAEALRDADHDLGPAVRRIGARYASRG